MARNMEWKNSAQVGVDGFCRTLGFKELFAQDYYGDFSHFAPANILSATTYLGWTVTALTAGTLVQSDLIGGCIELGGGGGDGQGIQMQQLGLIYLPTTAKDIFFECRIKATDADDIDWMVGLASTDTDIFSTDPTELIVFRGDDGDANIDFQVRNGGTGAAADTGVDLTNLGWVRLGFHVQDATTITPYVDGVAYTAVTTNIPTAALRLTFGMEEGATEATQVLYMDWFRILQFA